MTLNEGKKKKKNRDTNIYNPLYIFAAVKLFNQSFINSKMMTMILFVGIDHLSFHIFFPLLIPDERLSV